MASDVMNYKANIDLLITKTIYLSFHKYEEFAMTIRDSFEHWRVCNCCSTCVDKVEKVRDWAGMAWTQLWVHLKLVPGVLVLLVLL